MSQILQIELPDPLFAALTQRAAADGTKPEDVAVETLQERFGGTIADGSRRQSDDERLAAQARFERHIGTWDVGHPLGTNNEQIDADLATEYGRGMNSD